MNELTFLHKVRKNVGFGMKDMYWGLSKQCHDFVLKYEFLIFRGWGFFPSQFSDQHPHGCELP